MDEDKPLLSTLQSQSIDGAIILFGMLNEEEKKRLMKSGLPTVFMDQEAAEGAISSVIYESYACGRMAAEYLLGLGAQRFDAHFRHAL